MYVTRMISRNCSSLDIQCFDERYLLIDIVSRTDDKISQRLTIELVLRNRAPDEEGIRRALIHITTLEHPIQVYLANVKTSCLFSGTEYFFNIEPSVME